MSDLLEVYKAHAEGVDRLNQQSASLAKIFTVLMGGLIVALLEFGNKTENGEMLLLFLGVSVSVVWLLLACGYQRVKDAKLRTLKKLEETKGFPFPFFETEDAFLLKGNRIERVEVLLPAIFVFVFAVWSMVCLVSNVRQMLAGYTKGPMMETLTTLNIGSVSLGIAVTFGVLIAFGNWVQHRQRKREEQERQDAA